MTTVSTAIDPTLLVRAAAVAPTPSPPGLKRSGSEELSTPPPKVARSTDEEKKARLMARQQRNRHSAQVSREKKKAHVEQLELEVEQLRAEKLASEKRELEAQQERKALESQVNDLGSKVQSLEKLLVQLVQAQKSGPEHGVQGNLTELAEVVTKMSGEVSTEKSNSGTDHARAAPDAAPSTVASHSPLETRSNDSTCLPAAEATSRAPHDLAQQRVQTHQSSSSPVVSWTPSRCRQKQQPMAAALCNSYLAKLLQGISTATRTTSPALYCSPRSPISGSHRRVLRIRLRIPSDRLHMALKKHSLRQVPL